MHSDRELRELRGIEILYENDLHDLAELVLNIMDAADKMPGGGNTISRPTLNGLAKKYSSVCGYKISESQIIEIVKRHGFDGNDVVDFNRGDKRRHMPPKPGKKR